MDAVNRNIHLLLNSIQKSDVYRTYKKQEAILEKNPELVSRVQHFRSDNFRLQNEERGNLLQDAEQLARESAELRRNPEVNAYLDAELALCRMMQQICKTLTDGIEIKVPDTVLCKDTISSMQAGVCLGYIGQTEYIVKRMRKESGFDNMKVVATGGLGKMIYENTDCIDTYDPDLTLYGLRIIMDKQKQA